MYPKLLGAIFILFYLENSPNEKQCESNVTEEPVIKKKYYIPKIDWCKITSGKAYL